MADKQITISEAELGKLVDKRIADLFGVETIRPETDLTKDPGVMATPSVLSVVRATAYAHC